MARDAAWAPDAARDRGLSPPPAASRVRSSSQSIRSSAKVRVFGFSRTRRSVGSLEVGEHQDVQQLGAGSRTEGVETRSKPPFDVSGTPYPEPSMRAPEIIPLLVVPLLGDLPFRGRDDLFALDSFIWIAFVLEYGIRLYLAPSKRYFVSHNIIDLLFVLIPFLRPLRIIRSLRAFPLLRAFRGTVILLELSRPRRPFSHPRTGWATRS
jgi:hypothetical protein